MQEWYDIQNVGEIDSPALVVFPERVKHNIQLAIQMAGGTHRFRPHIKTHKSGNVVQLMMRAGITKFKCATIAEAELLAQCQAKDILVAYQPLGPKLHRFISLIGKYPGSSFSCLVDHVAAANELSQAFSAACISAGIYIDLNIGMNRTGIAPGEEVIALYRLCNQLPGLDMKGLHAYDGHHRDADFEIRKKKCDAGFEAVLKLKQELVNEGFTSPVIIAGGSPTFSIHCNRPDIECSPGTFIYWDKGYSDQCKEQKFQTAAVLISRIVSLPSPGKVCSDLGHKSVASENEITRRVFFMNAQDLAPVSQSEEHLVMETNTSHQYQPGDVLYGLPFHICPTVALYERVYTVENGKKTGEWKNEARDRFITV